jgi:hypothetical protein
VKLAKSWYKSLKTTTNKVFNWFKKAVLNHLPGPQLIKALVAIGGSFWLIFTGSLECTISILLLGWGAAELIDWLEWK